ncbi:MAG: ATP synthase subunit C [Candidatus Thorarchaeota archaeon]
MRPKTKFYLLMGLFQIFLVIIVLSSVNGLIIFVAAQGSSTVTNPATISAFAFSAAIAVAAGVLASSFALKTVGTAAISALAEREETYAKAFIIVALCEALSIYGLIIAVLLWTKIP